MCKGLLTPNGRLTLWDALTHDKDCHLNLFTLWTSYLTYNINYKCIFVHIMCEWLHINFDVLTLLIRFHGDNKYVVTISMLTSFCTIIIFSKLLLVDFFFQCTCHFLFFSICDIFKLLCISIIVVSFLLCVYFVVASTFVCIITCATFPSFSSFTFCFGF